MSMMRSKKKRPDRDDKRLKGEKRIEAEVFDRHTMHALNSLIERKVISSVLGLISRGKEACVFIGKKGEEFLAIKIFRVETGAFIRMMQYVQGDPRFEGALKKRNSLAFVLSKKEYGNLKEARKAGVKCPEAVKFVRNILITKFLGEDGLRYPKLSEIGSKKPEEDLDSILYEIKKLYKAKLVHADISEYNILMCGDGPYLIDFAQAVSLRHPNADSFMERDLDNLLHYFERKYRVRKDKAEVLKYVKG